MNIYSLSDVAIQQCIGKKIKETRLRQNISQANLAADAQISLSSVKKIENGDIGTFDNLLRVMRVLGYLDPLQQLVEEKGMSPNEYYEYVNSRKKKDRKRATPTNKKNNYTSDSEW